jgi:hypothetical protein
MSCPTSIVPGLDESSKIKNPALSMQINSLLEKPRYKRPKKKKK